MRKNRWGGEEKKTGEEKGKKEGRRTGGWGKNKRVGN